MTAPPTESIFDPDAALADVRATIADAASAAGRDPAEITLVAIGKTHPPSRLAALVQAGVSHLGENRVAELTAKLAVAEQAQVEPYSLLHDAQWHFVGQLQSRKARDVVGRDVLVHSVDRRSLVDELDRRARRAGARQRLLVQVNVGDDPAKGGCGLHEVQDLVAYACQRPNLDVEGLMTVPPLPAAGEAAAVAAVPHFATLRAERDRLSRDWPSVRQLSMGMTADLPAAVAEGATIVRVGTALFGQRGNGPWTGPRSGGVVR